MAAEKTAPLPLEDAMQILLDRMGSALEGVELEPRAMDSLRETMVQGIGLDVDELNAFADDATPRVMQAMIQSKFTSGVPIAYFIGFTIRQMIVVGYIAAKGGVWEDV